MPYHGLFIYFKLKKYGLFELIKSLINTVITEKNAAPLTGGGG